MNPSRRKRIGKLMDRIDSELRELLEELDSEASTLQEEEQEWFDRKSDKWKESDEGLEAEDRLTSLGAAVDMLEMDLDTIIGNLNDAQGEE